METQICPKCSEENPVEAVMCWACYTPLGGKGGRIAMETQNCPKCGEENPAEAVMCWACYTLLSGKGAPLEVETVLQKLRREIYDNLPYLLIAGLTVSGWAGRRARLPLLGASLAGVGAFMLREKWEERKYASPPAEDGIKEESPIVRIAQTILLYALKENASAIRVLENGRGVEVRYQVVGEWHQQMKIPLYVWRPLRQQLLEYARQGFVRVSEFDVLMPEDKNFAMGALRADLQVETSGETLELLFENVPVASAAAPPELMPDTRCQSCREENAPAALWCWNCYAVIEAPRVQQWKSVASEVFGTAAPLSIFGALGSSGWWPRRARPFVLGAGALGMAAAFAWCPLQARIKKIMEQRKVTPEAPVVGVASLIFSRALQTQSTQVRLQERGGVHVSFADEAGDTRAEIVLPAYFWLALRNHLLDVARGGFCTIDAEKRRLSAELRCGAEGETLELRLNEIN